MLESRVQAELASFINMRRSKGRHSLVVVAYSTPLPDSTNIGRRSALCDNEGFSRHVL